MKPLWRHLVLVAAVCAAVNLTAQTGMRTTNAPASFSMINNAQNKGLAFESEDLSMEDMAKHKKKRKKRKGRDQAFAQGKSVITIGYGFPNLTKSLFKLYQSYADYQVSGFGPMHVKYEYGVTDKIGLGLSIRYLNYKVQWTDQESITTYDSIGDPNGTVTKNYTSGYKGSRLGIMAHMNIHFATGDKIDPYWGFGIGYGHSKFDYFTDDPLSENLSLTFPIPIAFESTVGCRFYFSDNFGAYLEAGWGASLLQGGIAIKF